MPVLISLAIFSLSCSIHLTRETADDAAMGLDRGVTRADAAITGDGGWTVADSGQVVDSACPPGACGQVYYVARNGDDLNNGSQAAPWRTVKKANQTLVAGDTVYIRGSDDPYGAEGQLAVIAPAQSGTAAKPIRYVATPGDNAQRAILADADVIISLIERSHITVDGFDVRDPKNAWLRLRNAHNNTIKNCKFTYTDDSSQFSGWGAVVIGSQTDSISDITTGSTYNKLLDNQFEKHGTAADNAYGGPALLVTPGSRYNLIEGNLLTRGSFGAVQIFGDHNVIRKNTFSNDLHRNLELGTLKGNLSGANLVEENSFNRAEFSPLQMPVSGIHLYIYSPGNIIRRNVLTDAVHAAIYVTVVDDENTNKASASQNKIFHNTIVHNGRYECALSAACPKFLGKPIGAGIHATIEDTQSNTTLSSLSIKNNILFDNRNHLGYKVQSNSDLMASQFAIVFTIGVNGPWDSARMAGNAVYGAINSAANTPTIYVEGIGLPGSVFYATPTIFDENFGTYSWSNKVMMPWFKSYPLTTSQQDRLPATANFSAASNSPTIDQAVHLTWATSAGSGTVIPVAEARYFHNGYGGLVNADMVKITGQRVQIVSVDYDNNTITINQSLTWKANDPVYLPYNGTAPDIGAYEY